MGIQCPRVGCGSSHTPQVIILVMLNQEFSPVVQLVCHRVQSSVFVISITLDDGFYCISAVLFNLHAYGMNSLLLAYFSSIWISLIVYIVSAQYIIVLVALYQFSLVVVIQGFCIACMVVAQFIGLVAGQQPRGRYTLVVMFDVLIISILRLERIIACIF